MLLAGACVEAMREFAVERRQRREALVQTALGKLRFGLVQEMFANWRILPSRRLPRRRRLTRMSTSGGASTCSQRC